MRSMRMFVVVALCLVLAAPVLAVENEQKGGTWWESALEWLSKVVHSTKGEFQGGRPEDRSGGGELEPNGLDPADKNEKGGDMEPNG